MLEQVAQAKSDKEAAAALDKSSIVKQDAAATESNPPSLREQGRLWERMTSEQALWQAWQKVLANGGGPGVDGDIAQCFERIAHVLLLELLGQQIADRRVLRLIRTWLEAQVMNELTPASVMGEGVHQGGAISPLLSNVYLHEFDARLTEQKLALVRYADDWLILCRTEREAQAALQCATDALARLRLMVNPSKTRITHFDQGFAFIGMFFLGERTHWLSPAMAGMQLVGEERSRGNGERGMGQRLLRRLLGG